MRVYLRKHLKVYIFSFVYAFLQLVFHKHLTSCRRRSLVEKKESKKKKIPACFAEKCYEFEPIKYRLNRGWLHHIAFYYYLVYSSTYSNVPIWYYKIAIAHTQTAKKKINLKALSYNSIIVNYRLIEFQREKERKIFKCWWCTIYGDLWKNKKRAFY